MKRETRVITFNKEMNIWMIQIRMDASRDGKLKLCMRFKNRIQMDINGNKSDLSDYLVCIELDKGFIYNASRYADNYTHIIGTITVYKNERTKKNIVFNSQLCYEYNGGKKCILAYKEDIVLSFEDNSLVRKHILSIFDKFTLRDMEVFEKYCMRNNLTKCRIPTSYITEKESIDARLNYGVYLSHLIRDIVDNNTHKELDDKRSLVFMNYLIKAYELIAEED